MKHTLFPLFVIAALGLSACTDQPVPAEPAPSVTQPAQEPSPASTMDTMPSQERLERLVTSHLPDTDPQETVVGAEAIEALVLSIEPRDAVEVDDIEAGQCPGTATAQSEVAVHVTSTTQEDPAQTTALTAIGFTDQAAAEIFTGQLHDIATQCGDNIDHIATLTHHTDAAFEVRLETPEDGEDGEASVVIVHSDRWVLAAGSDPAVDVALNLTLVDQLDELLR